MGFDLGYEGELEIRSIQPVGGNDMETRAFAPAIVLVLALQQWALGGWQEFPICTEPSDQWQGAAICDDLVVWKDMRNGADDIYGYSLSGQREFPISSRPGYEYMPAVSQNYVVYGWQNGGDSGVIGWERASQLEFQIAASSLGTDVAISTNTVVWRDGYSIYGKRLPSGQSFSVGTCNDPSGVGDATLDISGNLVVWKDGGSVFCRDLSGTQTTPISTTGFCDSPATSGEVVVWTDSGKYGYRGAFGDIWAHDIASGKTLQLSAPDRCSGFPDIYGDLVVWVDSNAGGSDIYGCYLSTLKVFQICMAQGNQTFPAVWGDKVVWTDYRNGQGDIYGATVAQTPPPPTMTHSLNGTGSVTSTITGRVGNVRENYVWTHPDVPGINSGAGNYVVTTGHAWDAIASAGDLGPRPDIVLMQMSILGAGQPISADYISLIPVAGVLWNWYIVKPVPPQADPRPQDRRQRSLSTTVCGQLRLEDSIGRDEVELHVDCSYLGMAAGYGRGVTGSAISRAMFDAANQAGAGLANALMKIAFTVSRTAVKTLGEDDAVGFDSRFRAMAQATFSIGEPVKQSFTCPAITADGSGTYIWLGGGTKNMQSIEMPHAGGDICVPTNQDIPVQWELYTGCETTGYASASAQILGYRVDITCPSIPEFGVYSFGSKDYTSPPEGTALRYSVAAMSTVATPASFRAELLAAASSDYLKAGSVSLRDALGGSVPDDEGQFVLVDGSEVSGLLMPVIIPEGPKEFLVSYDLFASHNPSPGDPIEIQVGLIQGNSIIWFENIDALGAVFLPLVQSEEGYCVHTGFESQSFDISGLTPGSALLCIAVDASDAPLQCAIGISDVALTPEPATLSLLALGGLAALLWKRR